MPLSLINQLQIIEGKKGPSKPLTLQLLLHQQLVEEGTRFYAQHKILTVPAEGEQDQAVITAYERAKAYLDKMLATSSGIFRTNGAGVQKLVRIFTVVLASQITPSELNQADNAQWQAWVGQYTFKALEFYAGVLKEETQAYNNA